MPHVFVYMTRRCDDECAAWRARLFAVAQRKDSYGFDIGQVDGGYLAYRACESDPACVVGTGQAPGVTGCLQRTQPPLVLHKGLGQPLRCAALLHTSVVPNTPTCPPLPPSPKLP